MSYLLTLSYKYVTKFSDVPVDTELHECLCIVTSEDVGQ